MGLLNRAQLCGFVEVVGPWAQYIGLWIKAESNMGLSYRAYKKFTIRENGPGPKLPASKRFVTKESKSVFHVGNILSVFPTNVETTLKLFKGNIPGNQIEPN